MVFSSHIFVYYFLPAALLLYYASLPVSRYVWSGASALTLTFCSYVFYGWNRPDYCLLMLASSLLDFGCGRAIVRARAAGARGTLWLVVSLTGNLGLLAWFKYSNLMVDTWNDAVRTVGAEDAAIVGWARVALPVGISFYTFQTMSYTIDLWRGAVAPARSFWDFMAYVSMFPQLVAGPIVRYSHVAEELAERSHTLDKFYRGVLFFQFGLAKKVLIADNLSDLADQCFGGGRFAAPEALGALDAWTGTLAYAFQIYFDFSGYSDMAIGLGLMLGFSFPINFDRPYLAVSVTDFWRRWHLSLSTWLRDYLYIPLGGNRRGPVRTHVNLALTMLLGGLWHGAQWTFVAWGAWQAFWLIVERRFARKPIYTSAPRVVQITSTFVLTLLGWVVFRAPSVRQAAAHYLAMFGAGGEATTRLDIRPLHGFVMAIAAVVVWTFPTTQALVGLARLPVVAALQPGFLLALCHLHWEKYVPFLYFQF